jgi:serpin B
LNSVLILVLVLFLATASITSVYAQQVIMAPLKQIKSGILVQDVKCKDGYVLVIKESNENPACIKPTSLARLYANGWITLDEFSRMHPITQNGSITIPKNINTTSNSINQTISQILTPADASNRFAFEMFSNLSGGKQENSFFSPYSISSAFSIVYEGAKGTTRDEIQSVFHFIKDDQIRRNSTYTMLSELNGLGQNYTLSSANALWVQNNFPLLKEYTDVVKKYYLANATNLDFKNKAEDSRQTINKWVEDNTNNKIKDLLPVDSINDFTRAVITNAVYFKGFWTTPFNENLTEYANFSITEQHTVKVPMMNTLAHFNYSSNNDLQVLQMPYKGNKLSMLVLLPKNNDIQSLEQKLSATNLNEWKSKLTPKQVQVSMPKFTLNTKYALVDNFKGMGISSAFNPDVADFSGMDGTKNLYITGIFHQAFVAVDEKGTEAAAATGITIGTTSMPPPPEIFRADHPFVFLIQDDRTGLILFMGKVVDPSV